MGPKNKDQRVAVFIDVQNLYHSAKNLYQARVNFREILKEAVAARQLIRAFAYVVRTKTGEEKPFFDALLNLGIETRVKDLQEYYGGLKKADWDVGIAVDAIKTADRVDVIVIVSGDGDYVPLVDYLINHGRRVEVMAFGKSTSSKLREAADEFIDLEKDSGRFLLLKKSHWPINIIK
ncbi:MAG: NYN domain-containing protein [Candidatus Wildermuthbacteria bacterium]|nr:NYN domain-containing protein [Candidatus Wildermuthbacteria bacterium]